MSYVCSMVIMLPAEKGQTLSLELHVFHFASTAQLDEYIEDTI